MRAGEPDPDAGVLDLSEVSTRSGHLLATAIAGGDLPFDIDLDGATCDRFLVVA